MIIKEVIKVDNTAYFRPTKAVIDLSAIRKNVANLKEHLQTGVEIIAVVKANAYGHGDVRVSLAALQSGATMLAVATPEEALKLREAIADVPILILGAVPTSFVPFAAQNEITLTVFSKEWVEQVKNLKVDKRVKVHLKIDSGMGRIGVTTKEQLLELFSLIQQSTFLELDGVFTHFATADEEDTAYYEAQKSIFIELIGELPEKPRLVHAANTAASLVKSNVKFDAVRFGISMYGLPASTFVEQHLPFTLQEALTLESEIVHVKKMHKGEHVGYGATYEVQESYEWVATLPIGYADGLLRGLEGQEVLVNGKRAPIIGRICMDQTMVKLPEEMKVGDRVVLIGKQGQEEIKMQEWADRLNTIVYEISCMLSERIARMYSEKE